MASMTAIKILAALTTAVALFLSFVIFTFGIVGVMPEVDVTLANDGSSPVLFMCQRTNKSDSLYTLLPNSTYRFSFTHLAFPMRWCFLYISPEAYGFFWAYTVRSRCTQCFWSINKHASLYRGDKGRWERQKLFTPPQFYIDDYMTTTNKNQALSTW